MAPFRLLLIILFSLSTNVFAESKIIGIVLNKRAQSDLDDNKKIYGNYGYYSVREHYSTAIEDNCSDVSIIFLEPDIKNVKAYAKIIDGLLIPGNTPDVDPKLYGEKPIMNLKIEKYRSEFEIALLRELNNLRKPVLGICAGAQIMNIAFGGSLYQDISTQLDTKINHNPFNDGIAAVHEVEIKQDVQHIFGGAKRYAVNSAHHQAIKDVADGFTVIAKSDDDVIEGIKKNGHPFMVGVQWHPEFQLSKNDQALLKMFCTAVKGQDISGGKSKIDLQLL